MLGIASLFIIIVISLLVTRVATVMLTLTGLSQEVSQFQARSAFTGVGFTTSESDAVMNHPVRRRIIMTLVLFGNAGIVTALGSVLLSFSTVDDTTDGLLRIGLIAAGLGVLWLVLRTRIANRLLSRLIERALRRFTDLDTRDFVGLLRLSNDWVVAELEVRDGDWLCDVALGELDLVEEGVVVLGIDRSDGHWVGAPSGTSALHGGDLVVLYGTQDAIDRLDQRHRGRDGELDRLTAEIEFTERYLRQQELERALEAEVDAPVEVRDHTITPVSPDEQE